MAFKNYMDRGRQQVLYNYLPGKTFDHDGGSAICIVTDVEGSSVEDLNKSKIVNNIGKYIYGSGSHNTRWSGNAVGFPDRSSFYHDINNFVFIKPEAVRYDVFPLVFQCQVCDRIYSYDSVNDVKRKNPELICVNNCGHKGRLIQIHHVFVHECGDIQQLQVPSCPKHGRKHITFSERRSQQARDFRWICKKCNTEVKNVFRICIRCKSKENNAMHLTPHRANMTYYPHYIRLVDVGDENRSPVVDDKEKREKIAKYLNVTTPETALTEKEKSDFNFYKEKLTTELPEQIKEFYISEVKKIEAKIPKSSARKLDLTAVSEQKYYELDEYLYVLDQLENDNINERAEKLRQEAPGTESTLLMSKDMVNKCGIADIHLIEKFPVVSAVFGYTRVSSEPQIERGEDTLETVIHPFPKTSESKLPIYIDKGGTEALLFKLDPGNVVRWLKKNSINIQVQEKDTAGLKEFFLKQVSPIDRFAELYMEDDEITFFVFNLLHSLAHCLIGAASLLSGFEKTGMSEYIFPGELAFVIYSNKTDFTIGGFHTLFERYLPELIIKSVIDPEMKLCVYDPVCISKGGACHGCMHLPEISCSYFNRQLGRVFLYGGKKEEREVAGFWEDIELEDAGDVNE